MSTTGELHAEIATLRSELEALRAEVGGRGQPAASTPVVPDPERSRRNVLKLAAAGLGGVGLAQLTASPASAGNGANIVIGSSTQDGTAPTGVSVLGSAAAYGFAFTDNGANTVPIPTAIMGHARGFGGSNFSTGVLGFAEDGAFYGVYGDSVRCGVIGVARGPSTNGWPGVLGRGNGDGVQGEGLVGVRGFSNAVGGSGVLGATSSLTTPALRATADSGLLALDGAQVAPPTAGAYRRGDVLSDKNGSGVWVCVSAGTPGTWRKVAGVATAGSFHPLDGARAYNSRTTGGKLAGGKTRTVTVPLSIVPAKTTAIHYVLTASATTGSGSLVTFATGRPRPAIACLSWWGGSQKHSSGLVTKLNGSRQLSVYATAGSTHFTIDVLGYYR